MRRKERKYWGYITTVFATEDFTLKEVFMKAGTQSSMEYHVKKDEYYYIQSGKLKVGMRIGRAKNKSLILEAEGRIPYSSRSYAYAYCTRGYYS